MIRKPVTIQNNMDMEDRPVAHLVQEASSLAFSPVHLRTVRSFVPVSSPSPVFA